MLKWLKNAWPWSSENPNDAIWPKDFNAKDVLKAIENLPHVKEEKQLAKREELFQEGLKRKPALKKATTRSKTMPLVKSKSPKAVGTNYKTELKAGKKPAQALAIALSVQDKAKKPATKKTTKKGK